MNSTYAQILRGGRAVTIKTHLFFLVLGCNLTFCVIQCCAKLNKISHSITAFGCAPGRLLFGQKIRLHEISYLVAYDRSKQMSSGRSTVMLPRLFMIDAHNRDPGSNEIADLGSLNPYRRQLY